MASGRPFLQIPGPTNVPDRVLRAMDRPVIDHRGPEFAALTKEILPLLRTVFGTRGGREEGQGGQGAQKGGEPILYPSSGTGAWEAALVNVLAPGDRVLAFTYGHFSAQFAQTARNLGFDVDEVPLRWGQALTPDVLEAKLRADHGAKTYKAILVVQNETATGVLSDVGALRQAIDAASHDALLIVDSVSALGSTPFQLDAWKVDVALAGSQKGLMLPPGMALLCVGPRAREVSDKGGSPRHFFDWRPILRDNAAGFFPYTPATLLLFGLREALMMLVEEEGLENVYARHNRLATAVRAAVRAWSSAGCNILCESESHHSPTLTAVTVPSTLDSDSVIKHARDRFGLSLGVGLGQVKGKLFRIGHLGALNELEVLGTLGGVELTLRELGLPITLGSGVAAAQQSFLRAADPTPRVNGASVSTPRTAAHAGR